MALTPGTRLGPYEITGALGAGGMGEVYRARDTRLQRHVALKILPDAFSDDADRLARFTREAQTLAALNHPHIAHLHGLEEHGELRALDSRWIGFWQGGYLKKVAESGGTAIPICAAAAPFGASWHEDGSIVFGLGSDGIWRVAAGGGTPEQIVVVKPGEVAHGPQMLPDGNHLIFTLADKEVEGTTDWSSAHIVVESLRSHERKVIVAVGSDARFISEGYLVYGVLDTVFAVPFDLSRLQTTGDPIPIAEGVMRAPFQTGAVHFSTSREGTLAFAPTLSDERDRQLTWIDRTGRRSPLEATARAFDDPRLSPRGDRVAIHVANQSNLHAIWTIDVSTGASTQISAGRSDSRYPIWAPDGGAVFFGSERQHIIVRQPADGRSSETLLEEARSARSGGSGTRPIAVTDGGRTLVVQVAGGSAGPLLQIATGASRSVAEIPSSSGLERPVLSPDGQWVAYQTAVETGRQEVFLRPFPNLRDARIPVSVDGGSMPRWSRDGKELFFLADGATPGSARLMATEVSSGSPIRLSHPTRLFDVSRSRGQTYDVSPDGKRFLFAIPVEDQPTVQDRIVIVEHWLEEIATKR